MDSRTVVVVIVVGLAVAASSYFAWISIQSLLQARLLFRIRTLAGRAPSGSGPFALHGTLTILDPLRERGMDGFVWYRKTHQVYRRRGKHRRWETVDETVRMAGCLVTWQGREFRLEETPTEVQGTESFTEYHDGGTFRQLFTSIGDRRVRHSRLAVPARITVAGRLERRPHGEVVVKDNKVGLLLSPHEPSRAASVEFAKGLAGILGVTLALAAGLWFYYSLRE